MTPPKLYEDEWPRPLGPAAILVGVPGAGKTTVGQALAEVLGLPFMDTDAEIVQTAGYSIPEIFVDFGEAHFRALEVVAVAKALGAHLGVLALGGGAILDAATRAMLIGRPVIWLQASATTAAHRVGVSGPRPVAMGNVRGQLQSLSKSRGPLYAEVARLIIDTENSTPIEVAKRIASDLAVLR